MSEYAEASRAFARALDFSDNEDNSEFLQQQIRLAEFYTPLDR